MKCLSFHSRIISLVHITFPNGSIEIFIDQAENPNFDKVQEFVISVNERVERDETEEVQWEREQR